MRRGDDSGNEMIVRFRLPSGLEIFGFPTKNFYGGHWDLGPTWNYAVLSDKPFLVDAGRFGQGKRLVEMMAEIGISAADLEFVLISHSHEDHDGGLAELVDTTRLNVKAHALYDRLINTYPAKSPPGDKKNFPAKCWHCPMPETFYAKNCLEYHRVLQGVTIDPIADGETVIGPDIRTRHLPGHSPDCLAVRLGEEAIIVGDIILPDISPWPTRKSLFDEVAAVIKPDYAEAAAIFGLGRYIRSLKELIKIAAENPGLLVLPAHRFYYHGSWNPVDLGDRAKELLEHHVQRCGDIIDILRSGAKTAEEIAAIHFEERLLEGFGSIMAANEIESHCELLTDSGDVAPVNGNSYVATGSMQFETDIRDLVPET
jgi:glyoxylase-like metal-dependent hydrolase (beta-lactamase superfamily II)